MKRGRFSCQKLSRTLLELLLVRLAPAAVELIVAIDDTLIKKWGRQFFGLGRYPDPTDKNPGAGKRRVWGHCWVVAALLLEQAHGQWFCFPLAALLFVPEWACQAPWPFASKIELARLLLRRLALAGRKLTLVVDNLYAKAELIWIAEVTMVSRLRSNAALYDAPPPRKKGQRGRPRKRGQKVTARHLWAARKSKRRVLKAHIYGKLVTIEAFVDVLISSPTLGSRPLLVVIFPQRSGGKMNVFFSTDLALDPVRLLELYAARFKIEDAFDELKTVGRDGRLPPARLDGAQASRDAVAALLQPAAAGGAGAAGGRSHRSRALVGAQGHAQRDAHAPRVRQSLWNFGQFASKAPSAQNSGGQKDRQAKPA